MIRVVADTNILISALVYGGLPGEFLDRAFAADFMLITSSALLTELDGKLRGKFGLPPGDADSVQMILRHRFQVLSIRPSLAIVLKDPDDDRVLECALKGKADYIVTGDGHLLELGSFGGATILKLRQFLEQLDPDRWT